jgi:phosphatidylglycerophosphatase A
MSDKLIKICSTVFYVGYFPLASGTAASAVGAVLAYFLHKQSVWYVAVLLAITGLGFLTSGKMEKIEGKKDPGSIVIDEVAGMMISFFMIPFSSWAIVLTTFFLFRAFDMFKIYPSNKLEDLGGSTGVMIDDIVAGIYTNLVMQIALRGAGIL